ncbi:MAG: hypothetical protein K2N85_16030 [Lachnospiraceae bacterium]|nr:hypothetical protein [Lachnospiraceae bacterium]
MKFEYRYLSEKRAAEFDAMGLRDPNGKKIHINYSECVTNEDELVVFQKIYFADHYNYENDCDQYILFYKGYHYFLKIEDRLRKETNDGIVSIYFKFIILDTIPEREKCSSEEVLSVLKDVLYEKERHIGSYMVLEGDIPTEIIYKGEKIYG